MGGEVEENVGFFNGGQKSSTVLDASGSTSTNSLQSIGDRRERLRIIGLLVELHLKACRVTAQCLSDSNLMLVNFSFLYIVESILVAAASSSTHTRPTARHSLQTLSPSISPALGKRRQRLRLRMHV